MRDPAEPNPTSRQDDVVTQPGRHRPGRERLRARPALNSAYRVVVGALGGVVVLAGVVLIPYPGPGWLVVFAGLGILATEFVWAHHVNTYALGTYRRWAAWLRRQHPGVRIGLGAATGLVVLVTLWLTGALGLVNGWLDLGWDWLSSPLAPR
ncbi:TIGR02611 family protein [Amycolatopsis arida]|uniref:TIGR02611 family protein n=1 Tax=Amycolatopsis arida TaxID=587909 RepID=A0A1I5M7C0_9PSEU|nr:uncharacterized protein (TIGR02611 family) [Amycolatopsis arida]SFP05439.1 TIGR02611 family protein [Amycolatopsis arida]